MIFQDYQDANHEKILYILSKRLNSHRVFFRVGIRRVSRDDVANPSERAARAKPESWGDD